MPFSIGVIGLGRMAQAILLPLIDSGYFNQKEVLAVVGQAKTVEDLQDQLPKGLTLLSSQDRSSDQVWTTPIKLLAIKPQQLDSLRIDTSQRESSDFNEKPLLISILAGVTLKKLQTLFPDHCCVRVVPNTPSIVGAGLSGLSWGEGISKKQQSLVESIFRPISEVFALPEEQLDAFLALTSSGPAYVALIAEALADGAVATGLPRQLANYLAHRTLAGSAMLLKEKEMHPGQLKDLVTSPAGTTIAALRHLEMAGIRSALIEAVVLAAEKSRELS